MILFFCIYFMTFPNNFMSILVMCLHQSWSMFKSKQQALCNFSDLWNFSILNASSDSMATLAIYSDLLVFSFYIIFHSHNAHQHLKSSGMQYLINIEDMYKAVSGSRSKQPMPTIMTTVFKTKYFGIMSFYPTQLLEVLQLMDSTETQHSECFICEYT